MSDILKKLVADAKRRVKEGYYEGEESTTHQPLSLKNALMTAQNNAIIAEIKPISPALGPLRPRIDVVDAAIKLAKGGSAALSVLTEPDNFGGSMANLRRIREKVDLPLLMKDIIVDKTQIHAGRRAGADCILLIESVFSTGNEPSLEGLLRDAHDSRLEVLLEVHTEEELEKALGREADIIGLNNRNLATLETNLNTTTRLLRRINNGFRKPVISESGFENANDIRKVKSIAVHGFLIGSSIMLSNDMERKVREFVVA